MTRNTADYQRADSAHYIHPFTDSKALGTGARIIQRAEGVYLWDSDGNKILDGMSGCGASTSATVAANWLRRRQTDGRIALLQQFLSVCDTTGD